MSEKDIPEKFVPRATLEFHLELIKVIRLAEANSFILPALKERMELLILKLHSLPFEKDTIYHSGEISSNPLDSEITTFAFLSEYDVGEIRRLIIMPEKEEGEPLIKLFGSEKGIEFHLTTSKGRNISFIKFRYHNERGVDIDICYEDGRWYVKSDSKTQWRKIMPTFLTTMERVITKLETDFSKTKNLVPDLDKI